jgi:enoyl-CoA hydratase
VAEELKEEMTPWKMAKPVIAAVQGHVLGGGCELTLFCDLVIAADNAVFGEPESRFSQTGPAFIMPWMIGHKRARELLYFGDTIDAQQALDFGMINRVVPLDELAERSMQYAKRLALISPEALRLTKLALRRGAEAAGLENAMVAGADVIAPLYAAKTEFGLAFREKIKSDGLSAALKWRASQFKHER